MVLRSIRLVALSALVTLPIGACGSKPKPAAPTTDAAATAAPAPEKAEQPAADVAPSPTAAEPEAPAAAEAPKAALKLSEPKEMERTEPDRLGTREDDIGLAPGTKVPDFTARTYDGVEVTLANLVDGGPALIVFYRGGWCPFCNLALQQAAARANDFEGVGVRPVFVSADAERGAQLAKEAYEVPFPVLSDPDLKVHDAFGVTFEVPPEEVERLKGMELDLEAWSERKHHKLAVPGYFLVDTSGTVVWAHTAKDYKKRPSVDQLLDVSRDLQKGRLPAP